MHTSPADASLAALDVAAAAREAARLLVLAQHKAVVAREALRSSGAGPVSAARQGGRTP
jgi:hypothetical protein